MVVENKLEENGNRHLRLVVNYGFNLFLYFQKIAINIYYYILKKKGTDTFKFLRELKFFFFKFGSEIKFNICIFFRFALYILFRFNCTFPPQTSKLGNVPP